MRDALLWTPCTLLFSGIEEGLQQLEPDENAAFTMPDISLFNDSLDDSYHAKALGLTAEANESAVASKSGADLDDSLCMQEEGTETPAHENELDNTLLDDPIEDGLQVDMAVVPKPSPEGKLSVSLSKHIIPDHLGYHTDDTSQGDHTAAEKECTCKDDGNTGPTTGKAAANDKKVVPSFGRPRKGVTTPKAQAPTAKKTSRALTSPSAGSTSANQTPAKSAAPVESDSGTKPDELGQGETDHAEADKDSSALSVTSRPQKPKFGPSKCKKLSANSTSRSAPKKTVSKVRPDKQVELDQGHEMKSQFGPPKCKATGNPKSATSESSIKGEDKSASKAERKAEQKRKKEEREAKKQEKEQQKQEKDKKRAEKQQQKEEKRLEQERKKAEREQKKMEKEIKKIERDQKKVQKETTGQQQKKKAQPKTAKGNGEHDSDGISVSKSPTRPSNDDTDDSSNGAATEILTQAPPGLGSDEERNPEPICGSAKVTTSEDKPQMHQQDSSNSSPKAPSEPRLTSLSGNSPQQSEAAAPSVTAAQVSSAEEDTTEMGDIPGPGKSTGDGEQTEQNVATNQEDNAGDAGNASLVQQESEDSTDKDMEGGNNVASPRRLPDASLNETATKENIKPNSCVNAKPSSKVEPRGGKDCQVSLQKLQVKTASVKSKRPGSGHKRALNRPTVSPKAHRKPPASKRESTRQPSRKRKAVESVSSGSDSHTSDPDSKPPRKKQQRSAPTNYSGPVWVQCERTECQKWRQLRDCLDPSKVPSQWECSMNTGINSLAIHGLPNTKSVYIMASTLTFYQPMMHMLRHGLSISQ